MMLARLIGEAERQWLENHLSGCSECSCRIQQTRAAVAALKSVSISATNDMVQSTRRRVRELWVRDEARKRRMRPIWISSAFASVWMACSTPYLWQSFDLTGHWLHIPDLLWQMAFLVTWFTPALTGAAVALWLRPTLARDGRALLTRPAA
jgi:anti-sigma factor RsiW